ncbi:MAG: hypothetical protein WD273_12365 [Trueperaceae bacterium]
MDDRERIDALAADGRITREEADRLLSVLDDIDQTEQELGGVDDELRKQSGQGPEANRAPRVAEAPEGPEALQAPESPREPGPATAAKTARTHQGGTAPEGLQWVEVNVLAGDLEIEVDKDSKTPTAVRSGAGEISLDRTERGFKLGSFGSKNDSILGRIFSGISQGNTKLTIPPGWGIRLQMKAGEVNIHGPLAFLSGHLLAGDLDADEVHGVDLNVSAGDIDLGLKISEGSNLVHAVAGDINVRLLPGSDVKVSGRVSIGDLSLPEGWSRRRTGLGAAFEHTLGEGRGALSLELSTGDLDVELGDQYNDGGDNG